VREDATVTDTATLSELAASVAEHEPNATAYVAGSDRLTYADWLVRADALGAELRDRGVGRGDVVALALASSIDFAIAYLATARIGAVVTALNTRLGPREIEGILRRCSPALVVHDPDAMALPTHAGATMSRTDAVAAAASTRTLPDPFHGNETAPLTIVWTSGSTGMPKGAWFDQRGCRALAAMSGVLSAHHDRRLMPFPFAHAGYMTRVWDQMHHVITSVITSATLSAGDTLAAMVEHRITVGQGVPTQWAKLVEVPELATADVSSLRICTTGAAPVPPELAQAITERFRCPVVVRYACTEAPILTGTLPGDPPDVLYGTVGRPATGVEVRLVAPNGAPPAAHGDVGQIHVRSAGSMRGFWNDPVATAAQVDADGWIAVGDLGRFDSNGNLILCGRTTEMYVRGGYNIYPLEVEHVLSEHPDVAGVAIVSATTPVIGEIGVAFVVSHAPVQDESQHAERLRAWVRERLADYKAPDRVIYVDHLPLTSMMKIDKQQLRQQLADLTA
jgi:acyl-CoA synthetase (AMP-forming)/AMP-acid ligase II